MSGVYCIAFIENNAKLFSLYDYKESEKIICKYFKDKYTKSRV